LALAAAAVHEERYDEAAAWMAKCAEANPDFGGFLMGQAAYLALAGRMEEARSVCARALELEPGLSVRTALSHGLAPAHEAKLVQGYRLLGLPEN
jgi:adenylate cyclase